MLLAKDLIVRGQPKFGAAFANPERPSLGIGEDRLHDLPAIATYCAGIATNIEAPLPFRRLIQTKVLGLCAGHRRLLDTIYDFDVCHGLPPFLTDAAVKAACCFCLNHSARIPSSTTRAATQSSSL